MAVAFIIGNGTSRQQLDLDSLRPHGKLFGCNALYRDYAPQYHIPDYLVAIDPDMINEIRNSDFPKDRFIVPPMHEQFEPRELSGGMIRSNAGLNAMIEAIRRHHNILYLIGFDSWAVHENKCLSNMYANTSNYDKPLTVKECHNRLRFFNWLTGKAKSVSFTICYPDDTYQTIMEKPYSPNVRCITFDHMKEILGNAP